MSQHLTKLNESQIIQALRSAGLKPRRASLPKGGSQVVVPLLDETTHEPVASAQNPELESYTEEALENWDGPTYLHIALRSLDLPSEVGVVGHNQATGKELVSDDWRPVHNLEELVAAFQNYWDQRDTYLILFSGEVGKSQAGM